jgi:hypothetical protein
MNPVDEDPTFHARRLPRSVEPNRDLWPEIESRLNDTESDVPRGTSRHRQWRMAAGVAAAAAAVLVVAIGLMPQLSEEAPPSLASSSPASDPSGSMPVSLGIAPELQETREALVAQVYQRLSALPPETGTVVVKNLETINRALDEIDRALREVPDSGLSRRLLMSMYADQLTMLTEMNALLRRSNQEIAL